MNSIGLLKIKLRFQEVCSYIQQDLFHEEQENPLTDKWIPEKT